MTEWIYELPIIIFQNSRIRTSENLLLPEKNVTTAGGEGGCMETNSHCQTLSELHKLIKVLQQFEESLFKKYGWTFTRTASFVGF